MLPCSCPAQCVGTCVCEDVSKSTGSHTATFLHWQHCHSINIWHTEISADQTAKLSRSRCYQNFCKLSALKECQLWKYLNNTHTHMHAHTRTYTHNLIHSETLACSWQSACWISTFPCAEMPPPIPAYPAWLGQQLSMQHDTRSFSSHTLLLAC